MDKSTSEFKTSICFITSGLNSTGLISILRIGLDTVCIPLSNPNSTVCVPTSLELITLNDSVCVPASFPLLKILSNALKFSVVKLCRVGVGCNEGLVKALIVSTPISEVGVSNKIFSLSEKKNRFNKWTSYYTRCSYK